MRNAAFTGQSLNPIAKTMTLAQLIADDEYDPCNDPESPYSIYQRNLHNLPDGRLTPGSHKPWYLGRFQPVICDPHRYPPSHSPL